MPSPLQTDKDHIAQLKQRVYELEKELAAQTKKPAKKKTTQDTA